jgi:hypothetical protein
MRRIRMRTGLLVTAGALAMLAIAAVPALAAEVAPEGEFVAGKIGKEAPFKIRGEAVGPQEFTFKAYKVTCGTAKVRGFASASSKQLEVTVAFSDCKGGPFRYGNIQRQTLPVKFKEKAALTYSYAGWVESGEEVEIFTRYLKCDTDWLSGIYPEKAAEFPLDRWEAAKYKTEVVTNPNTRYFPEEKQLKILITNSIKGHGLEWEEAGGGACEGEEIELSEGERGKYVGQLLVEVPNGNIEFKEAV